MLGLVISTGLVLTGLTTFCLYTLAKPTKKK